MVTNGGRCTEMFLSPMVLADSTMYSSSHSNLFHLHLYITPLFCVMLFLSLGATRRLLIVVTPLSGPGFLSYHKHS